eukprot:6213937-Pleurochrysis_carterae.AAC.4
MPPACSAATRRAAPPRGAQSSAPARHTMRRARHTEISVFRYGISAYRCLMHVDNTCAHSGHFDAAWRFFHSSSRKLALVSFGYY